MILHAEFRKKSPPLEGRVVVTWAAARSAEIFFLGLLLPPPQDLLFWATRKNTYWRNERTQRNKLIERFFEPRGKILTEETNDSVS